MKKPLLLDGKPFDPNPAPPTWEKIREFLDKRPGEIFSFEGVYTALKIGTHQIYSFARDSRNDTYVFRGARKNLFGTPSAIQQYRKMTDAEGAHES